MKRCILLTGLVLAACDGAGEKIDVSVTLPAGADATQVSALQAWVVAGTEEHEVSCNLLVAGAQEPYDVGLRLVGEGGVRFDGTLTATVSKREGVVFVVAFDYAGEPLYAGCSEADSAEVSVTLGTLRIYTCSDLTTPPGARCDDGDICTVGERCRAGSCTGGGPRDCSVHNGACSAGVCDPAVGCKKVSANEGSTCNDTLFCTGPGVCTDGTCVMPPVVCPPPPGPCLQEGVCSNTQSRCLYVPKPTNTPCDDGNPCRTGDTCDYRGACVAGSTAVDATVECDRNACTANDVCTGGSCIAGTTASGATSCSDNNPCTINETCSGTTCVVGGYASSSTPCWETSNYCYLGDTCTGFSATCSGAQYYIPDADGDGCSRYLCGTYYNCLDCDDRDPGTNPNAAERCADGKDNDCDGTVDESTCTP